jgi:hypothetical protein
LTLFLLSEITIGKKEGLRGCSSAVIHHTGKRRESRECCGCNGLLFYCTTEGVIRTTECGITKTRACGHGVREGMNLLCYDLFLGIRRKARRR